MLGLQMLPFIPKVIHDKLYLPLGMYRYEPFFGGDAETATQTMLTLYLVGATDHLQVSAQQYYY